MVRFCPKCGGLMKPVKSSNNTELVCVKCGHRMRAGERELEKYRGVVEDRALYEGENNSCRRR